MLSSVEVRSLELSIVVVSGHHLFLFNSSSIAVTQPFLGKIGLSEQHAHGSRGRLKYASGMLSSTQMVRDLSYAPYAVR